MVKNIVDLLSIATGITCHSGEAEPGYIFVAICGRKTDGNRYAAEAARRGAIAVVSDQPAHLPVMTIPVYTVTDARHTLSFLADKFYGQPSKHLALTGVSGSNGKTTITYMLEHIFLQAGLTPGLIGTVRVSTGRTTIPSTLTTPDAVSIQLYLAEMCRNGVSHAAMEISAQGVEMRRVDHVKFACGILSNICADHLDFHQDFASYLAAKQAFLSLLGPSAPLVVNIDDAYCRQLVTHHHGPLFTTSLGQTADLTATIIHTTAYGSKAVLTLTRPVTALSGRSWPRQQFTLKLPIPGRHNVENAVLAVAAAMLQDIEPAAASAALENFHGVERRFDIYHLAGLTIVDDTALNPGSIDAVFSTIKSFRSHRLIVVNAIRGQRGPVINTLNAACLARWQQDLAFRLIVTASSEAVGSSDKVTPQEQQAFLQELAASKAEYTFTANLRPAIRQALRLAEPGDVVILLGAQGMDTGYQILIQELAPASAAPAIAAQTAISV